MVVVLGAAAAASAVVPAAVVLAAAEAAQTLALRNQPKLLLVGVATRAHGHPPHRP